MSNYPLTKAEWGEGEWQAEPDRKLWRDPATGLACLAKRNMHLGIWCGYVAIPPGHPAYKAHYDAVSVEVHGGLTYSNECEGDICHTPEPGEPDNVWWLGFDCGHGGDYSPAVAAFMKRAHDESEVYRNLAYVEAECTLLAKQLADMGGAK